MRVSRQRCFSFRHSRRRQLRQSPRRASSTSADARRITRLNQEPSVCRRLLQVCPHGGPYRRLMSSGPPKQLKRYHILYWSCGGLGSFAPACRVRANHVRPTRPTSSRDVRFTSNCVPTLAPQQIDARCHFRTNCIAVNRVLADVGFLHGAAQAFR
jgi:hypothetical protein